MAYIYRYIDKEDNIIKYVGIVWRGNRSLQERLKEHKYEEKFLGYNWKIECIEEGITTRTDAEYFESHYISLFGTDQYLNTSKSGWGISNYLPTHDDWQEVYGDWDWTTCSDDETNKNDMTQNEYIQLFIDERLEDIKTLNIDGFNINLHTYHNKCVIIAHDIAKFLSYAKNSNGAFQTSQMMKKISKQEKIMVDVATKGGNQLMWAITLQGIEEMYHKVQNKKHRKEKLYKLRKAISEQT